MPNHSSSLTFSDSIRDEERQKLSPIRTAASTIS